MGNTQQLKRRDGQRTLRNARVFKPAATALLVALGVSGCVSQDQELKAYDATDAQRVAPLASGGASDIPVLVTDERVPESAAIQLRSDRPTEYVVVKGDTLWDIAGKFLHDPFQWPSVWKQNPQIANPHLIYPGDMIRLSVVGNRTVIDVLRPDGNGGYSSVAGGQFGAKPRMRNGREVLSPAVIESELVRSVSNAAADAIRDFTRSPHVVTAEELGQAAYVLGTTDDRLASANGDDIYARGFGAPPQEHYNIFRPSKPLVDPESGEVLGYEAKRVADARLIQGGDPVTLRVLNSAQETLKGDRLIVKHHELFDDLAPVAVDLSMRATVISLYDALSRAAQHQVVVLNKGRRDGLESGSVLEIASSQQEVYDERGNDGKGETVKLPERLKGNAIVFRTFEKVSYAMILEASLPIEVGDTMRGF